MSLDRPSYTDVLRSFLLIPCLPSARTSPESDEDDDRESRFDRAEFERLLAGDPDAETDPRLASDNLSLHSHVGGGVARPHTRKPRQLRTCGLQLFGRRQQRPQPARLEPEELDVDDAHEGTIFDFAAAGEDDQQAGPAILSSETIEAEAHAAAEADAHLRAEEEAAAREEEAAVRRARRRARRKAREEAAARAAAQEGWEAGRAYGRQEVDADAEPVVQVEHADAAEAEDEELADVEPGLLASPTKRRYVLRPSGARSHSSGFSRSTGQSSRDAVSSSTSAFTLEQSDLPPSLSSSLSGQQQQFWDQTHSPVSPIPSPEDVDDAHSPAAQDFHDDLLTAADLPSPSLSPSPTSPAAPPRQTRSKRSKSKSSASNSTRSDASGDVPPPTTMPSFRSPGLGGLRPAFPSAGLGSRAGSFTAQDAARAFATMDD